jgi:hypothetical protein
MGGKPCKANSSSSCEEEEEDDDLVSAASSNSKGDIANSLDAATLLVQAAHWALLKLRRFAHLRKAERRLCTNTRRRNLVHGIQAWKKTTQKLSQTFSLCDKVWAGGAMVRALQQLRLCMKCTASQEKSITKHIRKVRTTHILRMWRRRFHLIRAETVVRRSHRQHKQLLVLNNWRWCYRHIPGIVRFRNKVARRILYPCINHWRAKSRRLRKVRRVFLMFETSWQQRWLLVYGRTEKSRLFECFDCWTYFVLLVKAERHGKQQLQKALVFRSAALCAKCFMGWMDFHLTCLLQKRARLSKLHMFQRLFMHHLKELKEVMDAKGKKADEMFAARHCKAHLQAWWREAHEQRVLLPRAIKNRYLQRLSIQRLRMQRRVRVLLTIVLPNQRMERMRKRFSAWHRLFTRKVNISDGCTKLEHALMQMRVRGIVEQWPGRDSFQKAEKMRLFMEERGRAKVVLVNVVEKESEQRKEALKKKEQDDRNRSFLTMRKAAPLERRAALFGYIFSAEDPAAVENLFSVLRAVLYAWQDQAHTDAFMRGCERLVRYRHKRALIEQSLRIWIGKCPATSHRLAMWISKKYAKHANKRLAMSKTDVATKHLVAQYAKLGLDDLVDIH